MHHAAATAVQIINSTRGSGGFEKSHLVVGMCGVMANFPFINHAITTLEECQPHVLVNMWRNGRPGT